MSIIDDYMRIRDLKQDGLGFREAFDIIKNNIADRGLGFMRGQHMFDTPIKTKNAGTLYSREDLQSAYDTTRRLPPDAIHRDQWERMPVEDTSHLPPTSSILPSGPVHEPLIPRDVWESQPALQGSVLGAQDSYKYPQAGEYITSGYPGTRITDEYYRALENSLDEETLMRALGMAIAETGAGRDASDFNGGLKNVNFYGYHKGGNTYDPDLQTMIQDLQNAFGPGGMYEEITPQTLSWYVYGMPWESLSDQQRHNITNEDYNGEYDRYRWGIAQLGY
jgi:hypothetical protein